MDAEPSLYPSPIDDTGTGFHARPAFRTPRRPRQSGAIVDGDSGGTSDSQLSNASAGSYMPAAPQTQCRSYALIGALQPPLPACPSSSPQPQRSVRLAAYNSKRPSPSVGDPSFLAASGDPSYVNMNTRQTQRRPVDSESSSTSVFHADPFSHVTDQNWSALSRRSSATAMEQGVNASQQSTSYTCPSATSQAIPQSRGSAQETMSATGHIRSQTHHTILSPSLSPSPLAGTASSSLSAHLTWSASMATAPQRSESGTGYNQHSWYGDAPSPISLADIPDDTPTAFSTPKQSRYGPKSPSISRDTGTPRPEVDRRGKMRADQAINSSQPLHTCRTEKIDEQEDRDKRDLHFQGPWSEPGTSLTLAMEGAFTPYFMAPDRSGNRGRSMLPSEHATASPPSAATSVRRHDAENAVRSSITHDLSMIVRPNSTVSSDSNTITNSGGRIPKKTPKMHECRVCRKQFPRPSGLATHMNSHSGARPYKCDLSTCNKSFAVRSNARRHLRTHGIYSSSLLLDGGLRRPVDAFSASAHLGSPSMRSSSFVFSASSFCDSSPTSPSHVISSGRHGASEQRQSQHFEETDHDAGRRTRSREMETRRKESDKSLQLDNGRYIPAMKSRWVPESLASRNNANRLRSLSPTSDMEDLDVEDADADTDDDDDVDADAEADELADEEVQRLGSGAIKRSYAIAGGPSWPAMALTRRSRHETNGEPHHYNLAAISSPAILAHSSRSLPVLRAPTAPPSISEISVTKAQVRSKPRHWYPKDVTVPLPPAIPSDLNECVDVDAKFEERDSYAEAGIYPYHPEQWLTLPGPAAMVPLRG